VPNIAQPLVQASLVGEAIDHGPVLVLVMDEDGSYVAANSYACELLGFSRAELLEQKADPARPGRLTRKDGTLLELEHRTQPTMIAGMRFTVAVGWLPLSSPRAKRARRSAHAPA
jgi:PAS domain S-box-containing protein